MGRVVEMMGGLSTVIEGELDVLKNALKGSDLPPNWATPKISRGENYNGLPYVILDQPRLFTREQILAIRTMFWWGHYFSVTLHLKGRPLNIYASAINRHLQTLIDAGFHMAAQGDEWKHELEGGHYTSLTENRYDPEQDYPFVKLSAKIPLDKWEEAPELLSGLSKLLLKMLTA